LWLPQRWNNGRLYNRPNKRSLEVPHRLPCWMNPGLNPTGASFFIIIWWQGAIRMPENCSKQKRKEVWKGWNNPPAPYGRRLPCAR
jgi:hypothetical protein